MAGKRAAVAGLAALAAASMARAAETEVTIHRISADGVGEGVGTLTLRDHAHGMLVIPDLRGLGEPRPHAMHVHENGTCQPAKRGGETVAGAAAGGHYDPAGTGAYTGPYKPGALGDLPNLYVHGHGRAAIPVLAPRVEVADVQGKSVMIHAGPDRYGPRTAERTGHAHKHGGGRMYCGVIPGGG